MSQNRLFVRVFLVAFILAAQGCVSVHLRTANEYYQQFAYASAAKEYEYVLGKRTERDAIINVADCYRQMGNPVKTEYWYQRALKLPNPKAEWNLFYAEALMKNGNYEMAKTSLSNYLSYNKTDFRAQRLMESCENMDDFFKDTTLYTVSTLKFNTPDDNFFSPAFYRQGIVFLSDRMEKGLNKTTSDGTGKRFLDLFYAKKTDRGNWMEPEPMRGEVNGKFNEGPVVFSKDFTTMYFTRNNYVSNRAEKNSKNVNVLKIFRADAKDGEWQVKGPMYFNSDEYSVGHPALSESGTTIIFSSDMPWGYGGSDLYMVRWEGGEKWSTPTNLGPKVNTEGNELFPFMFNDSILYFSSDGHKGMGGLDIYESNFAYGSWDKPTNVGAPINSSQDDFSFIVDSTGVNGYFTSTRNGLVDKIYSFEKHPPQIILSMLVTDSKTKTPLPNSEVKVFSKGKFLKNYSTSAAGKLKLELHPERTYKLTVDNPEYYLINSEVSTVGVKFSEVMEHPIELRKILLDKPMVWQGISFKKKSFELKTTSGESIQRLLTLLQDNPRLNVEIGSYTDSRGSDAENLTLTQQRAELVVSYLVSQGINASRLTAKGYGETKLLNRCVNGILCIEEDHETNNRVEFTVKSVSKDSSLP
jgi:peptidoglycan-associated lipoprotein